MLTGLALFGPGFPNWIRYTALSIGFILLFGWLFAQTGWIGRAIKARLFRSRLSKDQATRLKVLLDEINNCLSYSYTLSPFYVCNEISNRNAGKIEIDWSYHNAIQAWLLDLNEHLSDSKGNTLLFIGSLSKAISALTICAERGERDLQKLLSRSDLGEQEKLYICKRWDAAKNHFNHWLDKWQTLFKEISKSTNIQVVQYFRPLEMIG